MSHFLANIMARNLGQTPVVQPRPISRFETQTTIAPIEASETAADRRASFDPAVEAERPLPAMGGDPIHVQRAPAQNEVKTATWSPTAANGREQMARQSFAARLEALDKVLAAPQATSPAATPVPPQPRIVRPNRGEKLVEVVENSPPSPRRKPAGKRAQVHRQPGISGQIRSEIVSPPQASSPTPPSAAQTTQPEPATVPGDRQAPGNRPKFPDAAKGEKVENSRLGDQVAKHGPDRRSAAPKAAPAQAKLSQLQPAAAISLPTTPPTSAGEKIAQTVLTSQFISFPPQAAAPRNRETTAEAPAVINVTIGRIEVKATKPAPAPAPKPARKPPAKDKSMSLDEYLLRRNRGS